MRAIAIWFKLGELTRKTEIVHVLAASWLYFFVVVCPAVLVGRWHGKRVVLNYRGGEAKRFFRRWGWAARPVLRLASVVTAPSEFLGGVIRSRFGVPVAVVPNILDTSAFRFRRRETFRPRLLAARHLERIYDVESVLKAFRRVQHRHPDASLWIAGSGSQESKLIAWVARNNLKNVRFLGAVPHRELPAVLDQCDIFINASRVDNFPGALLEASAAGLVVVSTSPGGIPFLYENGRTALLVEPKDWKGLAAAVESVLENPSLGRGLVSNAAAMVRGCDWTEVRRSLYRAYGFPGEGARTESMDLARELQ